MRTPSRAPRAASARPSRPRSTTGAPTVALSGTREGRLAEVAARLGGERVHVAPGDLSTAEGAEAVAKAAEAAMGQVDVLVNNAGMTRDNLAMRMKDEDFEAVLEVNLVSAFRLSRAVMRGMMKRKWGRIIGITSVVAFAGNPGPGELRGLQGGHGRHDQVAGGGTGRPRHHRQLRGPGVHPQRHDRRPDRRAEGPHPGDHSRDPSRLRRKRSRRGVVYLASQEAAYMTGQTLHINGGMAMY